MSLISELQQQGVDIRLDGEKVKLSANTPLPPEIIERVRSHKGQLIDELKIQNLKTAIARLELGETSVVRIAINDHEQVLILKDDEIPESIKVDCPSFTLREIKMLIGSRLWQIARLYELKIDDPTMRVVSVEVGATE
ncbi:MAG TPA: hypothetical protein ENI11_04690 [Actinobacteria bacterium]|nr:hypothetical protein [Actinomycetota bacterium]